MILHVTKRSEWIDQRSKENYSPADFNREGFIHCCLREQLPGVLQRYFKNARDLVLLYIDESKLTSPLRHEPSTNNENFPHIYGPVNLSAIVAVTDLYP
jgi:uncharacterized protein (DUF952 family)